MNTTDYWIFLSEWYLAQCNGAWEHQYGVRIETLDNPGWQMEVDLVGTSLENRSLEKVWIEKSDDNWLYCEAIEGKFRGAGDPSKLHELLKQFCWFAK